MIVRYLMGLLIISGTLFGSKISANDFSNKVINNKINKKEQVDTSTSDKVNSLNKKLFKEEHPEAKGLINIHKIDGKLYFEIPFTLFGKDLLMGSTVSETSDNGNVTVGSKPTTPLLVNFTFENDKVLLNRTNKNSIAPISDTLIGNAIDKNSIGAIMMLFKIEAYNPDSSAVVVDASNLFLTEISEITPFDRNSLNTYLGERTYNFQKERSFIVDFKSFNDNISVKSALSYNITINNRKTGVVYLNKPYTVMVTRSFLLLDEIPYDFRIADYRIGVFNSVRTMYSENGNKAEQLNYAHRWRIEPSDIPAYKKGEIVEPVNPIVFYVDQDFPEWWRPYIKAGIERWNDAFEKIGFKNVVRALDYPENNPDFDPDNIKYSCIRYSPVEVENAMGPSWVDPRSGEIINASVYVYHDVVKLINKWLFVQTSPSDARVRSTIIPEEVLGDALEYVIAHEVGHCLGFMHNMGASSVIPVDSLRSPSFTNKHGTTVSIMDYARFNYVAQPGDYEIGVKLTPPKLGVYDYFLVRWLYSPLFQTDPFKEKEILDRWITEKSGDKFYRYGKQQLFGSCDPTSQMEDLGDDPVKASLYGIKNLKYMVVNINDWLEGKDKDYSYRTDVYKEITNQYLRYLGHVSTNIGGIIVNEKKVGDMLPHFEIVSRGRQKSSLQFLIDQIYDLEWLENKDLLRNLPLQNSPKDNVRDRLANMIVSSGKRVFFGSTKSKDPYTSGECLDDIYKQIFKSLNSKNNPSETDMILQKEFIREMIEVAGLSNKSNDGFINSIVDNWDSEYLKNLLGQKPPQGFELWAAINYDLGEVDKNIFYGYLVKTEKALKKRVSKCSKEAKLHYELLIRTIQESRQ
ncbi:MAG: zinc-dependent metalloprotease [Bacteroidales bacterium]|nr:zinc-dependent metalloprotease [Bacteroidales bacterium]